MTLLGVFYQGNPPPAPAPAPLAAVLAANPPAEPGASSRGACGCHRSAVVARSPDRATSATEGLQPSRSTETFGPVHVRGQGTRAQPETRAQQVEDDVLVDLLARSIAAGRETQSDAGLVSRAGSGDDDLWASSLWTDGA